MKKKHNLVPIFLQHSLPSVLAIILFVMLIFGKLLPDVGEYFLENRKEYLKEVMDATWSHIDEVYARYQAGELTEEEAQEHILHYLENIRYGDEGKEYFWVTNTSNYMVMHPYLKRLVGKNQDGFQDADGKYLFRDVTKLVNTEREGFIYYKWWWKDDTTRTAHKFSYVRLFEPWGWAVGTGAYIDDIEADLANLRQNLMIIGLIIIGILAIFQGYLVYQWWKTETERRDTQESLKLQKEYYQTLFETSGDSMLLLNSDGIFTDCNRATIDIYGLDNKEDMIGRHVMDFSPPMQDENAPSKIEIPIRLEWAKREGTARFEWTHIRKNGEPFPAEVTLSAIDEDTLFAIVRDVSERQSAIETIQKERDFSNSIIETSPAYFIAVKDDGKILLVNKSLSDATGYKRNELIGAPFLKTLIPTHLRDQVLQKSNVQEPFKDITLLLKDGSERQVIWYGDSLEGGIRYGFGLDVTDKMRAERALREKEADLRITLSSIADGVISTDQLGRIVLMNKAAQIITGYRDDEALGEYITKVFDIGWDENPVARIVKGEKALLDPSRKILHSKAGIERTISMNGSTIEDENGLRGIVVVFRDITEEVILQQKLRHSQKMDAIGQLAGGVAHDFNNMLGGIMGAAELLALEIPDDEELSSYISMILSSSERAADLTSRLLAFSRRGKKNISVFDVNKTIIEVMDILRHTIDRRISLDSDLQEGEVILDGDETEIQNSLLNLGVNARDAMPEGGNLSFSTQVVELDREYLARQSMELEPGFYAEITVSDTGSGIPEDIREKIFEPFFTTKDIGKGTGLGLAAVYGTVRDHNGLINLYSETGQGTSFKIYLPLAKGELVEYVPPMIEDDALKGVTVLLVDDDTVLRYTAARAIEMAGGKVIAVNNGRQAIDYIGQGHDVDMIILDMVMPELGGHDTFRIISKMRPGIKILLSSGFSIKIDVLKKEGAVGFIQKPFRREKLITTILKNLD